MKHTGRTLWFRLPAIRAGRWLTRLMMVVALLLAPVLVAQAAPAHAGHIAARSDPGAASVAPQMPATGPAAALCHSGALCVFVGSFVPYTGVPAPVPAWTVTTPDAWNRASWIGAPGAQPPRLA